MTIINDKVWNKDWNITRSVPMRKSQQTIFWRNHKVFEIKQNGKIICWYGIKLNTITRR